MWCVLCYCDGYCVELLVSFVLLYCIVCSQVQTLRTQGSQAAWCKGYALLVFRRCPFRKPSRTPDIRNFNVVFHIQVEYFRASSFIFPRELLHNFSIYHTNIILVFYVIYSLMYWQLRKIKHWLWNGNYISLYNRFCILKGVLGRQR